MASNKIGKGHLKKMGFILHGDAFIHKGDVPTKEHEDD